MPIIFYNQGTFIFGYCTNSGKYSKKKLIWLIINYRVRCIGAKVIHQKGNSPDYKIRF